MCSSVENDYLGIHNDFSDMYAKGEAHVRVTDTRRATLVELLTEAIDSDTLSSPQAESLHGKLQFAVSGSFGKVGRAALLLSASVSNGPRMQTLCQIRAPFCA